MPKPDAKPSSNTGKIQPPKGTRDLYPDDLLKQRYITEAWRRVSIRHGFEEIAGPTFEMRELYTRKSGEGIVSELFSFRREGGDDDYALRPEFTPTLARMYADRAASLPSPTKWFTAGPYFRAERPQRGRLREFLQWNCDVIGGKDYTAEVDCDLIDVLAQSMSVLGLSLDRFSEHPGMAVRLNDRKLVSELLNSYGVPTEHEAEVLQLLDSLGKVAREEWDMRAAALGIDDLQSLYDAGFGWGGTAQPSMFSTMLNMHAPQVKAEDLQITALLEEIERRDLDDFCRLDFSTVRGLAYYTGTVFELIADGERAVAGGGRYDNLIELFGGPPTPAVGFGMGDVVLGLLLEDKHLMPAGAELREALSQPPASLRPEAFVVSADEQRGDPLVEPLLASLRRGLDAAGFDGKPWDAARYAVRPMHARRSYKTTRNLKKLLADGEKQHARFAVIVHDADKVQLRDLDRREELTHDTKGDFSVDPGDGAYVGRAIAERLKTR